MIDVYAVLSFPVTKIEEVEALSSIYGDEWCVIDEASRIFCIKISNDLEEPKLTACLQVGERKILHIILSVLHHCVLVMYFMISFVLIR